MQDNKVIWLEGMFLQPQHFQQQDRYFENLLNCKISAIQTNLWGLTELELDMQLISIGQISVMRAKGFFQDGTAFDIPSKDKMPIPFQIQENMHNTKLYLALPIKQQSAELSRYETTMIESNDDIVENSHIAEITIGQLNCKILSEQDDCKRFYCLQIAKICEVRPNYRITFDKNFIPHCLDVRINKFLRELITEFFGLLYHRSTMLAERLTDTEQSGTAEIVDFMLLQLMNRYMPIFHFIERKHPLHPENLFYILIQLMGELATFTSGTRRTIEPPNYQHHDLYETFMPIVRELRHALSMVLEQNAISIPLQARQHGLWVGQIPDMQLITCCQFILAVYSDMPVDIVRTTFPKQVKIGPVEKIQILVSKQLPGIDLQAVVIAPRQIPYHANYVYFSLNTKHELWLALQTSAGISLHIGNEFSGLKMELWAIKG